MCHQNCHHMPESPVLTKGPSAIRFHRLAFQADQKELLFRIILRIIGDSQEEG